MAAITIIRTEGELSDFIAATGRTGWVAMDTEFLRERTYAPELCLIQIADERSAACIDPLAMDDLSPLGALLAEPAMTKIFHSCRQDLEALDTRTPIHASNLYDTQLAAAFCGYGDQVSYAALVDSVCAVHLPKSHTRADWSRRPLPEAQLEYALDDVKYLPELRHELDRRLERKGRIAWHREACREAVNPAHYRFAPDDAWVRLRGIDRLDAVGQICAKKLAAWREQRAHDRNLPRGWILATPALLQICRERPKSVKQLAKVAEIGPRLVKHAGHRIIDIVTQSEQAGHGDDAATAGSPRQMLTAEQRRRVKEIMRLLESRAEQEGISRSLFANRQEVENFVGGQLPTPTDLPLFNGWRGELVGEEILVRYS